jgi:riboflavin kinase/FMN adenylyltransferase
MYGFEVEEISPFKLGDVTISSSKIRKAIAEGDMPTANSYLGYLYSIKAKVIHGLKLGSTELGYPTANLEVEDSHKIIPADGIYAVYASVEGTRNNEQGISSVTTEKAVDTFPLTPYHLPLFKGMMSIGMNPTVKDKGRSMEVNIFDFNEDIYGKELQVFFFKKLRNEEKFESMEALRLQLDKDKEDTLKLLG